MLMKTQCCSLRKRPSRGQRQGKSEGAASLSGDGALGASPGPTLLFQGGPQEEAETQASVLGEEGRVGEGALEVGKNH